MLEWLLSLFRKKPQPAPVPTDVPRATIATFVKDSRTGQPIVGAVFRLNDELRTMTNNDGYAKFDYIAQGKVDFAVEKAGYFSLNSSIELTQNTDVPVRLDAVKLPSPYPRINGQLRVDGKRFVDDAGITLPLFAHAGDLFALFVRDRNRAVQEIEKIAAAGYQGIRVWTVLVGPYWERPDRDVSPTKYADYWERWDDFLTVVNSEDLKLVVSQGDMNRWSTNLPTREAFAVQLAQAEQRIGNGIYAFLDAGNETWQNGEPDPVRLAAFVTAYRRAGGRAVLTLTSPPGEEAQELNEYSIDPAECYDVHGSRANRFYDKIRHIFSIAYEGNPRRALGIQSEPTGSGDLVSVTDNKEELNHEAVSAMAVMSLIARQAWVWFSGEGVRIQQSLDIEQGFASVPKIAALLPKDLMTFNLLLHSGDTWRRERLVDQGITHEVRMDGAQSNDGRCVYLFYGEPGTHQFRAARNFSGTLYNPATARGEWISKKQGETFTLTWDRARLFIGRKD